MTRRMWGLLLVGCGATQPTPMQAAEAACDLEMRTVISQGMCDEYEQVDACPAYILTQARCWVWLRAAEQEQSK